MVDQVQFQGHRGKSNYGADAAQISVRSDELWIYIYRLGEVVQVISAQPCAECRWRGTRLLRCARHKSTVMIARQLDLL